MTEVELCNIVKKSNLFSGFTLHEEVGMDMNGNSCDMVYHKDLRSLISERRKPKVVEIGGIEYMERRGK